MDWLRSCKDSKFKLFADDGEEVEAEWYFTLPGAKLFPAPHIFVACDWDRDQTIPDPVDRDFTPRRFRTGKPPGPVRGKHFCGPLSYFQGGLRKAANPVPLENGAWDIPLCCIPEQPVVEAPANIGVLGEAEAKA